MGGVYLSNAATGAVRAETRAGVSMLASWCSGPRPRHSVTCASGCAGFAGRHRQRATAANLWYEESWCCTTISSRASRALSLKIDALASQLKQGSQAQQGRATVYPVCARRGQTPSSGLHCASGVRWRRCAQARFPGASIQLVGWGVKRLHSRQKRCGHECLPARGIIRLQRAPGDEREFLRAPPEEFRSSVGARFISPVPALGPARWREHQPGDANCCAAGLELARRGRGKAAAGGLVKPDQYPPVEGFERGPPRS